MNKYDNHVYVIPEDDANRQIADGFILHHEVDGRRVQVMPEAGGWRSVLKTFQDEYLLKLKNNPKTHIVLLIDFDGHVDDRVIEFEQAIPGAFKSRVFVVGTRDEPETLKKAFKCGFEDIGRRLANDCDDDTTKHWGHEQLLHNDVERQRMVQAVKPFMWIS